MGLMHRIICVIILIFLAFVSVGCDSSVVSTPESLLFTKNKPPDIRGIITAITVIEEKNHGLHVEGEIQADTRFDKAVIIITDKTRIYVSTSDGYELATRENLKVGQRVECILVKNTILERYPVVGDGEEILILP